MFLPSDTPQRPTGKRQAAKPASLTPQQTVDACLKDVFPMRNWSFESRLRYTEALDPVLRSHLNGNAGSN